MATSKDTQNGSQNTAEYDAMIAMTEDLYNALPIDDLLPKMISKRVINFNDKAEIRSGRTDREKVEIFLSKLVGEMASGENKRFYDLINVMKESPKCVWLVTKMEGWISHYEKGTPPPTAPAAQPVTADSPPHSVALSTPDDQQSSVTVTQHQEAVAVHNVLPIDSQKQIQQQKEEMTNHQLIPGSVHQQSLPTVDLDIDKKLELQRKVLINCRQHIVQYLSPDDVVDHLIAKHLIGENAKQELSLPNKTPQEKNRIIVDQLSTGEPDALEKFCVILKKDRRTKHIADRLEKEWGKLLQSFQNDSEQLQHSTPVHAKATKEAGDDVDGGDQPKPKQEKEIPKEDLLYTLDDLILQTKDKLEEFDNDMLATDSGKKIIDGVRLLLMVVNPSEFYAAMNYFSKNKAQKLESENGDIYYVGRWGKIPAALVRQSKAGCSGTDGSMLLTMDSINLFKNLKVIIAVGVCGTMGRLGDVIVSSQIDGCDNIKIKGNEIQIINRAIKCNPGKKIHKCLKNNHETWSFLCTKPETEKWEAKAVLKPMLSGVPLVASAEYRNKLKDGINTEAEGLEMEGIGVIHGIASAEKRDKIEFIIVKAGCDYADEEKNKEWQPVAAMAAAQFVHHQLSKPNWLSETGNEDDGGNDEDDGGDDDDDGGGDVDGGDQSKLDKPYEKPVDNNDGQRMGLSKQLKNGHDYFWKTALIVAAVVCVIAFIFYMLLIILL